jgi:hypothetical protein
VNIYFILEKDVDAILKENNVELSDAEKWGWSLLGGGIMFLLSIAFFW